MKISIKIKKFGRGLHAYFPKKFFHEGQEIEFDIDEKLIALRALNIEAEVMAAEIEDRVVKKLEAKRT